MDTYSDIKSLINKGELNLPTVLIPVFQVWISGVVPAAVLELMLLQRAVCDSYTLVCPKDSELIELLKPDAHIDSDTLFSDFMTAYPQAQGYYRRRSGVKEKSEIVRFLILSKGEKKLYIESDVLLLKYDYRLMDMVNPTFSRVRGKSDINLIYSGLLPSFFQGRLMSLNENLSSSALWYMVRDIESRFNEDTYFHYNASRRG